MVIFPLLLWLLTVIMSPAVELVLVWMVYAALPEPVFSTIALQCEDASEIELFEIR